MADLAIVHDSDHDAVAALFREETEAFIAADFDRWAACWLHEPRVVSACTSKEFGLEVVRGWAAISAQMQHALANGSPCGLESFQTTNLAISVRGDMAWAAFDQEALHTTGPREQATFETRICERHGGRWKIVFLGFSAKRPSVSRPGRLAVDADRRVIWAEAGTFDALADHPGLILSRGQLRARRTDWDKVLGEALDRAATKHDFFEARRFSDRTGGAFRCPVVLGEDDDGRVLTCMVTVADGVTYVDTDTDGQLPARLMVAEAIFGLSGAQLDLCTLIAEGYGLTEAARALGVTVNTARTHLSRIYNKTGVNSQTALVRLLLSVG